MKNLHKIAKNIMNLQNFQGKILFDEPMSQHTTFKVGGNAEVFAIPDNITSLQFLLNELLKEAIPYFILGGGSNLVVSDNGIEGFVISTEKLNAISMQKNKEQIIVTSEAGCTTKEIIDFSIEKELAGFESFAGLPGTIGGAAFMNARCYDTSISDILVQAKYITIDNPLEIKEYNMNSTDWDYKKSPFQTKDHSNIILSVDLVVQEGIGSEIKEKSDGYIADRKNKGHFDFPSAGSVFKNNRTFGKPSGKIIDEANLKGYTVGKAQIAPFHGNFIINLGGAFADDIMSIVKNTKKRVLETTGYNLECEIIFVGKF